MEAYLLSFYVCVCPKPGIGFPTSYGCGIFYVLGVKEIKVIVCFVDNGGIVDLHMDYMSLN